MELIVAAAVVYLLYRRFRQRDASPAPKGMLGPVGWSSSTNWATTVPLAWAETKRLLVHPAFLAGVAFTPFVLALATVGQYEPTWLNATTGTALGLVPLGWLTIVAANLVALRPQRLGTAELLSPAPAPHPVRTTALLMMMIGATVVATAIGILWLTLVATRSNLTGSPSWAEAAAGVLIVAGAVAVGVAVARWLPSAAFGIVAVVVVVLIQARFLDVTTWPWDRNEADPIRFLAFLAEPISAGAEFLEPRRAGWHLVYLAGWITVVAAVALGRAGTSRTVTITLVSGLVVTAGAGFAQTRPLSTSQRNTMIAALTDPSTVQVCEEAGGIRYCSYPEFDDDIDGWRTTVEATLAVLPEPASDDIDRLEVRQRPASVIGNSDCAAIDFMDSLAPDVAARVSPAALWPPDGMVHPGFGPESFPCSDRSVHGFFLAVQTAAWATGLPPAPHGANVRCTATGQARSAIALWAAAVASPDGAQTLEDVMWDGAGGSGLMRFEGWNDPPMWGVEYAVSDARAALALLARPVGDVRAVLDEHWSVLLDPGTPTEELVRLVGTSVGGAPRPPEGRSPCP